MSEREAPENGFTLVEVLVVILIIGVLAAIAVPAFLNQRKEAVNSAVQSDLHNASVSMETELVKNNNRYPAYLPNYNPRSDGVVVSLVKAKSNAQQYCLRGWSQENPSRITYYDSGRGGVLPNGQACEDVPAGTSFAEGTNGKKIMVLEINGGTGTETEVMKALSGYGFGEVVYNPSATLADLEGYDAVASFGRVWPLTASEQLLKDAYKAGYKVISDSNDMESGRRPSMFSASTRYGSAESQPLYYQKTGDTSLSPSFPYTFQATAFNGDSSWYCNTGLAAGTVAVATSPLSTDPSKTCVTASASTNSTGGRWVHMALAPLTGSPDGTMLGASLDWLLM